MKSIDSQILRNEVKDYFYITLALSLIAFSYTAFLLPYEIVTGGLAGLASLFYYAVRLPIEDTFFAVNVILLIGALKILGFKFLIKTIYATVVLSFFLWAAQEIAPHTADGNLIKSLGEGNEFMAVIIGSFINGAGLAIVFLHNGSTGGVDIIAASVNKYRDMSLGTVIQMVDICIVSSSYFIFDDFSKIVFGLCTIVIETVSLDYIMNARRESVQFMIFSKKYQEIADAVARTVDTGVTILDGHGWYTGKEVKVLCTLTRKRNSVTVFRLIKMIDPDAFVSQSRVIGVYGEGFDTIKIKVKKKDETDSSNKQ
ncbi:MAG: YitT family protein [Prevotella sp.]|nr:YitT family protein [Prevotella sp.]MDO5526231.1 YitT family protein [Prevotella sp.]